MKKVLFGITNLEMGGAEKVLIDLVNNLCDEFEIEILTIYSNGTLEKDINSKVKIQSIIKKSYKDLNFFQKKFVSLIIRFKTYRNIIYKQHCYNKDIVISFLEGPITKLLSDCKNKKVAWIHTDLNTHYENKDKKKLGKDYKKYDKLVFVSNSSKESFDKLFNNRFVNKEIVINNYIDKSRIILDSNNKIDFEFKIPNFLVIARLVEAKGLKRLIKTHFTLLKHGLQHYIYVIGDGPLKIELEKLIKGKKVTDSFMLLGPHENPYPYLKKCDAFLLPSIYEGLPVSVYEAKILNKRIIVTKTGAVDALIDYENKRICENNDAELYRALKEEIENRYIYIKYNNYNFDNNEILEKIKSIIKGEY